MQIQYPSHNWRDGVCTTSCNNTGCNYDGGDCIQLCECWDKQELLENGICDQQCATYCDYDRFDCIELDDDEYFDECSRTFIQGLHQCDPLWIMIIGVMVIVRIIYVAIMMVMIVVMVDVFQKQDVTVEFIHFALVLNH